MKKLRRPRRLALFTVLAAMGSLSVAPAGALAESATESPGATVPAPPAEGTSPPAPGWVPQGEAAEDTGSAAAPTQRGSSLGSGTGSTQADSPEQPAPSEPPPAPTPVPSGSYGPEEAPSPSTYEEPASAPRAVTAPNPEPPAPEPAAVALGAADAVAKAVSRDASLPVAARPVADTTSGQAAAGSGGLLWPILIVGILILLYAGARVLLGPVELDIFRSGPFRRRGYPRV
jgi:hypothetical protein